MLNFQRVILFTSLSFGLASLAGIIPARSGDPPTSPPPQPARLVFLDETPVTAAPDKDGRFKFDFAIKNVGGKPGNGSLTLNKTIGKGCDANKDFRPGEPIYLEPDTVKIVHLDMTMTKLPATCYLQMSTKTTDQTSTQNRTLPQGQTTTSDQPNIEAQEKIEPSTSIKQVKLAQEYVTSIVWWTFLGCLAISIATVALAGLIYGKLGLQFGPPAWEFAKSWASTTTIASSAFTTAVTFSVLPELTQYASKAGYAILSLLISLLVVVAPFVFFALRDGDIKPDKKNEHFEVVYRGCIGSFLASCALTLFAGLAQLIVVFAVYREMFPSDDLWSSDFASVAAAVLGAMLCIYAFLTIKLTIQLQVRESARGGSTETLSTVLEVNDDEVAKMATAEVVKKLKVRGLLITGDGEPRPLSWPVL